jgi:hypothetical protein
VLSERSPEDRKGSGRLDEERPQRVLWGLSFGSLILRSISAVAGDQDGSPRDGEPAGGFHADDLDVDLPRATIVNGLDQVGAVDGVLIGPVNFSGRVLRGRVFLCISS